MSFLSVIGMVLFMFLLYAIKNTVVENLGYDEFAYIDPNTKEEKIVPAVPPNYGTIFAVVLFGLLFLTFIMFGVVALWDTSLFGGFIKL
jgi:hypothetical protein